MKEKVKKILVIIQRSNGDVLYTFPLISALKKHYLDSKVDILVNDDTVNIANFNHEINEVIEFSYKKKKENRFLQEKNIFKTVFKKYDISINLTSSDRSVLYCAIAGKKTISAISKSNVKSWWKKLLLNHTYLFDSSEHILKNNFKVLELLEIPEILDYELNNPGKDDFNFVGCFLKENAIDKFLLFHPSAQYDYKIYPTFLTNKLLKMFNDSGVQVVLTGSNSYLDQQISKKLFRGKNIFNLIGKTTISQFIALSDRSTAYVGMDTLNMHIASLQNKQIFAIYGPTNTNMWRPWSKNDSSYDKNSFPINYANIRLFQAEKSCVPCGKAGCNDAHGKSDCLFLIKPEDVFQEIYAWLNK